MFRRRGNPKQLAPEGEAGGVEKGQHGSRQVQEDIDIRDGGGLLRVERIAKQRQHIFIEFPKNYKINRIASDGHEHLDNSANIRRASTFPDQFIAVPDDAVLLGQQAEGVLRGQRLGAIGGNNSGL